MVPISFTATHAALFACDGLFAPRYVPTLMLTAMEIPRGIYSSRQIDRGFLQLFAKLPTMNKDVKIWKKTILAAKSTSLMAPNKKVK